MDIDNFIENNNDGVFKMETLLKNYPIRYIVISSELANYFGGGMYKKNTPVIINNYFPAGEMNLISTEDQVYTIRFNVPCICGEYSNK
jgi:hypothetical protein